MVYQGSKNRLAKYIVPIIQKYIDNNNVDTYIELMVGGANIIDKVECKNKIGMDINSDLISLLKYVRDNPTIPIAPESCSFEHYSEVRSDRYELEKYSQEYVALIGYCASYGGRYYEGGYGRDAKGVRNIYAERVKNLREQAPDLKNVKFGCLDYKSFPTEKFHNALYYLDIPYKNTKAYDKQKFNHEEFYDFCRYLSKDNIVLVSEYEMPDDFECIWEKERKVMQKSDRTKADKATEKLFILNNK